MLHRIGVLRLPFGGHFGIAGLRRWAFGCLHVVRLTPTLVTAALMAALKATTTPGSKWKPATLLTAQTASKLARTLARTANGTITSSLPVFAFML